MINFIAAIDEHRGLANDQGIPWMGKTPTDVKYFRDKTRHQAVLMGMRTYQEFSQPLSDRKNLVASNTTDKLRSGFSLVADPRVFLVNTSEDVWVIGGAGLFASTLDFADNLYLTLIEGNYGCTKFFPAYEQDFKIIQKDDPITENGITYNFTVWKRK